MQITNVSGDKGMTTFAVGALALLFSSACGGVDASGTSADTDGAGTSSEGQALRAQRRARRAANSAPSAAAPASTGYSVDPTTGVLIPAPLDPNVDPNSGVNYESLSNAAVDSGGQCVNGRAMSGTCPSYGVQCTYDEANVTHYCTCLFSNALGIQGWECR